MVIKEKDFVELEFTGTLEDGTLFDTTSAVKAKEHKVFNPEAHYHPMIVCVGERQMVPGVEDALVGKGVGTFKVTLKPEDAFGKKDAKLIQLIPTSKFRQNKINPGPGLQVNVDGAVGIVKTVSGGRTIVDFNHPLSGRTVVYEVEVKRVVTDLKEQIDAVLHSMLGHVEADVKGSNAEIKLPQELPKELQDLITAKLKDLTQVKEVSFTKK